MITGARLIARRRLLVMLPAAMAETRMEDACFMATTLGARSKIEARSWQEAG
jgi:hypothetical protein